MIEPWLVHFFQRHIEDDEFQSVPALDFLLQLPNKIAAEIQAVLDAVADAPPPSFSGGGKWEAMHGKLAGIFEIRVQGAGSNHRVFCLLERNAKELGGPSVVVIGGLSNRNAQPLTPGITTKSYRPRRNSWPGAQFSKCN